MHAFPLGGTVQVSLRWVFSFSPVGICHSTMYNVVGSFSTWFWGHGTLVHFPFFPVDGTVSVHQLPFPAGSIHVTVQFVFYSPVGTGSS